MTTRVLIDRNARVHGNQAYAGLEEFDGVPVPGARVEIHERETGLTGPAQVTEVDTERGLAYLAVDWSQAWAPVTHTEPPSWLPPLVALLDRAVEAFGQTAEVFWQSTRLPSSRSLMERMDDAEEAAAGTQDELE